MLLVLGKTLSHEHDISESSSLSTKVLLFAAPRSLRCLRDWLWISVPSRVNIPNSPDIGWGSLSRINSINSFAGLASSSASTSVQSLCSYKI